MKVLIGLTYYRPYTSGLTVYAERLARVLVARGHQVTVLASRHSSDLPSRETRDGVDIVRVPAPWRVGKGVIMPALGRFARQLCSTHDLVNLHLPQLDAIRLAVHASRADRPLVLTYHCDLRLPSGLLNHVSNTIVNLSSELSARYADSIVTHTNDYADSSAYLTRHRSKVHIIPPPVDLPRVTPAEVSAFARRWDIRGPVVGMVARLAAEKGVEVLLKALPLVIDAIPNVRVLFAGPHEEVLGEGNYARRLAPLIEKHKDRWDFLGKLSQRDLSAFYSNCSTLVLPSLNSTEAFGLVQVEAMLCGTPTIASALPGVRQPVLTTGMGEIVPIGDSDALARSIVRVIQSRERYLVPRATIASIYSDRRTAEGYEALAALLGAMV